ncbi:MAG: DUF362 domain-containing protein [Desulfopila sp.]|jgi:uncharacterized protein (DUF362 family)|nr:DUF362 domain-containing protein [Desulfopila sp.]
MHISSPSIVFVCGVDYWHQNTGNFLDKSGLGRMLDRCQTILIKPNLVENLPPPITTPAALVEEVVLYLLDHVSPSKIVIGEGCGATEYDTGHVFRHLGYFELAQKFQLKLIDLNKEQLHRKTDNNCRRWPEIYLPQILDDVFLLSIPQLKAHSLAGVTLTMKNMMGCAPPCHYRKGGAWNKASFHHGIHEAIFDLNRYRTPDYSLLDASIGMARAHLWGPQCSPPVGKIAASTDPVAIDSHGTALLGKDHGNIGHIAMADGILGYSHDFEIITIP